MGRTSFSLYSKNCPPLSFYFLRGIYGQKLARITKDLCCGKRRDLLSSKARVLQWKSTKFIPSSKWYTNSLLLMNSQNKCLLGKSYFLHSHIWLVTILGVILQLLFLSSLLGRVRQVSMVIEMWGSCLLFVYSHLFISLFWAFLLLDWTLRAGIPLVEKRGFHWIGS